MKETLGEDILHYLRHRAEKPLKVADLKQIYTIDDADTFKTLMATLNDLENQGLIVKTRSKRYGIPEKMNLLRGTIQGHAKGFAFLLPEDENNQDVFISHADLDGAMHGDKVLVRRTAETAGKKPEGTVVRVIERYTTEVVGTYSDNKYFGFVIADDKRIASDIFIPKQGKKGAVDGHKVVVDIKQFPSSHKKAEGHIKNIIGHKNDPGVDILSIVYKNQLPLQFSDEVRQAAERVTQDISASDLEDRRDLREETTVTIDGADAKDLDDAVAVKKLANGHYQLSVHIADVSYYVTEGSTLDEEAFARGTSTYLVDRVIPMIPHRLSNGICSLNPREDRLTISCVMEIDDQGKTVDHDIFPSVIRTNERMTYTDVRKILQSEDEQVLQTYQELVPFFQTMGELADILHDKRKRRGAIDFDFAEAEIIVDQKSAPTNVVLRERSVAERLIESFMLAANETVAEHFYHMNVPFMYRIHEAPQADKLASFFTFITHFGHAVKGTPDTLQPGALSQLLEQIEDEPEEGVISKVLLRSMQQAKYNEQNLGHFGLATDFYTHFTSPIRRYPDLIVHRLIRQYLFSGQMDGAIIKKWEADIPNIADHSSRRERQSIDAEREVDDLKKAEYMKDKIGEVFTGIVNGVTNFGMFVELPNTIEGLVHISYLTDDYYHYLEDQYALIGERTNHMYRLGDEVRIWVSAVNIEERTIDFQLADDRQTAKKSKKKKPAANRKPSNPKKVNVTSSGKKEKKQKKKS